MPPSAGIGFGTWPLGGHSYGPVAESDALGALDAALERGVEVFDTANIYGDGRAEELLGRALRGEKGAKVVSKCGYVLEATCAQDFSRKALRQSALASLGRLGRPTLDVLLLHSPPRDVLEFGEACSVLDTLRDEGAALETGVSLRSIDDWDAAVAWPGCTVVELILNLLDQRPIDREIVDDAVRRGIRLLARVPLNFGLLSGHHVVGTRFASGDQRNRWPRQQLDAWITAAERFRFLEGPSRTLTQAALTFAASRPGVWAAIPGMKSQRQVHENVAAADMLLDAHDIERISVIWWEVRSVVPA